MIMPLIFAALVLIVTYLLGQQGMFSALIMAVLTICCAAGAIGSHEWVAVNWLAPMWRADYANALALAGCFGVPLIVLRIASDKLIRRSAMMPGMVEKIGGGFCGLITALVAVGLLAHALQMVPFKGSMLGYSRVPIVSKDAAADGAVPLTDEELLTQNNLFFQEDRFAVGLASLVSSGIFSNGHPLHEVYPDKVAAVGWVNAVPSEVSRFAGPDAIKIVGAQTVPFVYIYKQPGPQGSTPAIYDGKRPPGDKLFQMVRVRLGISARSERKTLDFTLRQFRLVGQNPDSNVASQYFPIAIQQEDSAEPVNRHIRAEMAYGKAWPVVDSVYVPRADNDGEIEMVFELPKGFVPQFIEYKGHARATLKSFDPPGGNITEQKTTTSKDSAKPDAPSEATTAAPPTDGKKSSRRRRRSKKPKNSSTNNTTKTAPDSGRAGSVRGATTLRDQSFFGDAMPVAMRKYRQLKNADLSKDRLKEGHLVGFVDEQAGGSQNEISKFGIDPDLRLLHLHVRNLQARSGLGKSLSFAIKTLQNYYVEDNNGERYKIIGKYAIASVNGRDIVEVQYLPNQGGTLGGLGKFDKILDRHLKNNNEFVLLFLVKPGVTITAFSTGGSATRRDNLTDENLVAPL